MPSVPSALNPLVLMLDRQGCVVSWSRSFRSRAPQLPEARRGKPALRDLFEESDLTKVESIIADGTKRATTTHCSWRAGSDSRVSWTALAIRNPSGVLEFVVVTGVEDEGGAEPPSARPVHDCLLSTSPFEMWAFDRGTYEFLAVNEATAREHGYAPDELRSMRVLDLWPWEEAPRLIRVVTELTSEQTIRQRARHRRRDGTLFAVESEAVATESAGQPACLVLSQPAGGLEVGPGPAIA